MPKKLPSQEWCELLDIMILDPDGWDRTRFTESWAEPITIDEFKRRCWTSTHDVLRFRELFGR
jgi:hypothetical protein